MHMRTNIASICTSWPGRLVLLGVLALAAHRLADGQDWLALAALVLAGALLLLALSRLAGVVARLGKAEAGVSRSTAELAALHAVAREVVADPRPHRVFVVLERECRKVFEFDVCLLALADRSSGTPYEAYRNRAPGVVEIASDVALEPLITWVREERRAIRIDDLTRRGAHSRLRGEWVADGCRSLLVSPLLFEGRVLGALALESARPAAYDDRHLELLTTIVQQAALVLEDARRLERAAIDSLTGLCVRDQFFARLEEEDQRARRYGGSFAVLMADLDGFKEINDRNGHWAGDRYLHEIGAVVRDQLRAADIACRYGGDEFCLLLPQTGLAGARAIAERIRCAVSRRIVGVEGLALRTTVSIGIAVYPEHHSGDLDGLLRKADEAMYRAKRSGRDLVLPAEAA
jgi:diguanylate cyclase (GGDEF)-like protein